MAYSSEKNPFEEEDSWGGSSGVKNRYVTSGGPGTSPFDDDVGDDEFLSSKSRLEQAQDMKQNSMNNQLDSTRRALASIYDSEAVGVSTAEELVQQGEQLDNIETKTDKINQDMRTSQRHLTSIKSVFGGIKNWWKGEDKKVEEVKPPPKRESKLKDSLDSAPEHLRGANREHPALRVKADTSGFYDEADPSEASGFSQPPPQKKSQAFQQYDRQFNENLEEMTTGMGRLKSLAMGLGDEIATQNDQVDRINVKVERADIKVRDQNRQMNHILK